jgi:hypothetical protein
MSTRDDNQSPFDWAPPIRYEEQRATPPAPSTVEVDENSNPLFAVLKLALGSLALHDFDEAQKLGAQARAALAAKPAASAEPGRGVGEAARDAARFRLAIAEDDNAETLYAAVLSHAPDGEAIRREFDSYFGAPAGGKDSA